MLFKSRKSSGRIQSSSEEWFRFSGTNAVSQRAKENIAYGPNAAPNIFILQLQRCTTNRETCSQTQWLPLRLPANIRKGSIATEKGPSPRLPLSPVSNRRSYDFQDGSMD
jgi:hypothetical protein